MVASSSAGIGIRCDTRSLAARTSTGARRRYWMRLPGGSRTAGSRGSGGGRGQQVGLMAKWTMHLSMARGPMETQGALVDGTVRSEVSQVMTLEAVFRVRRQQQHNRDMDDDGSSNNNNNNNMYLCQMAQAAQTTMMTTRTAHACATH